MCVCAPHPSAHTHTNTQGQTETHPAPFCNGPPATRFAKEKGIQAPKPLTRPSRRAQTPSAPSRCARKRARCCRRSGTHTRTTLTHGTRTGARLGRGPARAAAAPLHTWSGIVHTWCACKGGLDLLDVRARQLDTVLQKLSHLVRDDNGLLVAQSRRAPGRKEFQGHAVAASAGSRTCTHWPGRRRRGAAQDAHTVRTSVTPSFLWRAHRRTDTHTHRRRAIATKPLPQHTRRGAVCTQITRAPAGALPGPARRGAGRGRAPSRHLPSTEAAEASERHIEN